jgi:hypothetical protein
MVAISAGPSLVTTLAFLIDHCSSVPCSDGCHQLPIDVAFDRIIGKTQRLHSVGRPAQKAARLRRAYGPNPFTVSFQWSLQRVAILGKPRRRPQPRLDLALGPVDFQNQDWF